MNRVVLSATQTPLSVWLSLLIGTYCRSGTAAGSDALTKKHDTSASSRFQNGMLLYPDFLHVFNSDSSHRYFIVSYNLRYRFSYTD